MGLFFLGLILTAICLASIGFVLAEREPMGIIAVVFCGFFAYVCFSAIPTESSNSPKHGLVPGDMVTMVRTCKNLEENPDFKYAYRNSNVEIIEIKGDKMLILFTVIQFHSLDAEVKIDCVRKIETTTNYVDQNLEDEKILKSVMGV